MGTNNPLDKKRVRMAKDRQMALASAHVKLKLADDLLAWSLNQEIMDVLPKDEIVALRHEVNELFRRVWSAYSKESRD